MASLDYPPPAVARARALGSGSRRTQQLTVSDILGTLRRTNPACDCQLVSRASSCSTARRIQLETDRPSATARFRISLKSSSGNRTGTGSLSLALRHNPEDRTSAHRCFECVVSSRQPPASFWALLCLPHGGR